MNENIGNQYRNTSLRNSGRKAGIGVLYDDYSEDSGWSGVRYGGVCPRFPHDDVKPEELNGPVVIVQKEKEKEE